MVALCQPVLKRKGTTGTRQEPGQKGGVFRLTFVRGVGLTVMCSENRNIGKKGRGGGKQEEGLKEGSGVSSYAVRGGHLGDRTKQTGQGHTGFGKKELVLTLGLRMDGRVRERHPAAAGRGRGRQAHNRNVLK